MDTLYRLLERNPVQVGSTFQQGGGRGGRRGCEGGGGRGRGLFTIQAPTLIAPNYLCKAGGTSVSLHLDLATSSQTRGKLPQPLQSSTVSPRPSLGFRSERTAQQASSNVQLQLGCMLFFCKDQARMVSYLLTNNWLTS